MTDHRKTISEAAQVGTFYLACRRVDGRGSCTLRESEVVPIASMYKVLLALEIADAFERGDLDPAAQIRVGAEHHSPGGLGLNQFAGPVTISMADLLYLSLAWSDNTASDLLLARVGLDALHTRAKALGLETVQIVGDCRTLLRNAGEDLGYASEEHAVREDWAPTSDDADFAVGRTTRASAADLARLGVHLALETAACRLVREMMGRQIWTTRFAQAFPAPQWTRAAKTGTLAPWRGEFGLVTRPDGARLAVAVVVRQHRIDTPYEIVDRAVGSVARSAVELALTEDPGAIG